MAMLQLLALCTLLLAGSAQAQSDFCEEVQTAQLKNDGFGREEVVIKYLKREDKVPLASDTIHDLIVGNCTTVEANPMKSKPCLPPKPDSVAFMSIGFYVLEGHVIYCIKVLDRLEDGTGGFPIMISGGIGHNSVGFNFYSQYNEGIRFYVEIHSKDAFGRV